MYGLRLRRSPTLAAAGFIIPIVNFWWPYQAAADLLPPGSPDRRLAGWWWGSYIATIPLAFVVGGLSLVSTAMALVPAVVEIVLLVVMVTAGRGLIEAVGRAHAAAVTQRSHEASARIRSSSPPLPRAERLSRF